MINEITSEDLKEMNLPIKKRQWASSKDKKNKFQRDKEMFKKLTCKHEKTTTVQQCDDKNDEVYDIEMCLICKEPLI